MVSGGVDTAASTTVFSATGTFLSDEDDAYNGLIVEFSPGSAIAGERATVVDYDGATRTFTVDAPFTVEPTGAFRVLEPTVVATEVVDNRRTTVTLANVSVTIGENGL